MTSGATVEQLEDQVLGGREEVRRPSLDPSLLCVEKSLVRHEDLYAVRQSATTTAAEALLQKSRRTWWQGQSRANIKVPPKLNTTRVKIKPSPPVSPSSPGQNEVCVISQLFVTMNRNSAYNNHNKGESNTGEDILQSTEIDRF